MSMSQDGIGINEVLCVKSSPYQMLSVFSCYIVLRVVLA